MQYTVNLIQLCMHVCLSNVVEMKAVKQQNGNTNDLAGDIMGYNSIQSCSSRQDAVSKYFFLKAIGEIALNLESTQFFFT